MVSRGRQPLVAAGIGASNQAMQQAQRRTRGLAGAERNRMIVMRAGYWIFALFELMAFVPMLSPALFARVMGIRDFHPGADYTYAMGIAATFTLGWIALVIWADRKPVERRAVMLLTAAPVLAGNLACGVYAAASGLVAPAMIVPASIVQVGLIVLFVMGYRLAGQRPARSKP